jgi:hypothetical protein
MNRAQRRTVAGLCSRERPYFEGLAFFLCSRSLRGDLAPPEVHHARRSTPSNRGRAPRAPALAGHRRRKVRGRPRRPALRPPSSRGNRPAEHHLHHHPASRRRLPAILIRDRLGPEQVLVLPGPPETGTDGGLDRRAATRSGRRNRLRGRARPLGATAAADSAAVHLARARETGTPTSTTATAAADVGEAGGAFARP